MSDRDVVAAESYGKLLRPGYAAASCPWCRRWLVGKGFCPMVPTFRCLVMSGG
jgi:hypothetical protein